MAYRRGQYGKYGDIGKFGILGGYGTPEIGDSIFNLAATDYGNAKIKPKRCKDGSLPPCDEDIVTNGGGCLSHQRKNPITGKCEDKVDEKCPRPGERWNGYKCVKDERVINTPVGDVNVSGTLYGMNDARNIYDLNRDYMANYSGLVSGNNIFETGPYGLEGPESSMSGFNQIGQPFGLDFINRIGQKRPEDWTQVDEDEYVMAMSGQDYVRYQIDVDCITNCEETVVNISHLNKSDQAAFKKAAKDGKLPGQKDRTTGVRTSAVKSRGILSSDEDDKVVDNILETVSRSSSGDDSGEKKTTKKTRRPPQKATKTKTKTKTKTAASRASAAAAAAAMSRVSGASKAHKTRMSRVVDPWAHEDKRARRR